MKNILIADDHQIVIDGICSILENSTNYRVVATAADGAEAKAILQNQAIDIAILDIEMPEPDGVELTRWIAETKPEVKVLVLTMHNQVMFISEIMAAGASGYILKNKGKEELVVALDDISAGQQYYGKEVTAAIVNSWTQTQQTRSTKPQLHLTRREKEVLGWIAEGYTTKKIAATMFIEPPTVETHRRNLIDKIGVGNSKELIVWAIKNPDAW